MPPIHTIQPTFSGGELAPSLQGRVDLAKYATGLKTCKNFIIHPHGGASNRPGFKYIAKPKYANKKCRLVEFEFSDTQAYIIEFGDLYCRFFTDGGQIQASGLTAWSGATPYVVGDMVSHSAKNWISIQNGTNKDPDTETAYWTEQDVYEIATPYLEADLPYLRFAQSADTLFIAHGSYAPRTLVRSDSDSWAMSLFDFLNGPLMDPVDRTALNITSTNPSPGAYVIQTGTVNYWTDRIGSVCKLEWARPSESVGATIDDAGSTYVCEINTSKDVHIVTSGTWTGSFIIQKSIDDGTTWVDVSTTYISVNDANFDIAFDASEECLVRASVDFTSGSLRITLSSEAYTHRESYKIISIVGGSYDQYANAELTDGIFISSGSADYSYEGAWSDYRGWPSVVTFYQDRLGWASSPMEPDTSWYSQIGDYTNYGVSDPLIDSDAISISIPSRELNQIMHLIPMQGIVCLTVGEEVVIGPGNSGIFSPLSIDQKIQGYRGSSIVGPVTIGNRIVYVQSRSAVVRDLGYELSSDGFTSEDISILSSHLFTNHTIVDMCYQQTPDSLVWAVRDDGVLLSLTYMREQQVLAWSHHDTDGTFEAIASIPGDGYDELWAVTLRGSERFIERMAERDPLGDIEDQFFVDCGMTYDEAEPATTITNLDHLIGKTVAILADGIELPEQVVADVDGDGQITLEVAANVVQVGLPYDCDLETLSIEVQAGDGTIQGRKARCSQVITRFLNSRGGKIGPDEDHLYDLDMKSLATLEDPLALVSGDVKQTTGANWDNCGRVFYRQDKPLPVTILAFMPVLTVGG